MPRREKEKCRATPSGDGWVQLSWGEGLTGAYGQIAQDDTAVGHVVKLRIHLHKATLFGFDIGEEGAYPERQE